MDSLSTLKIAQRGLPHRALEHHPHERLYELTVTSWLPILCLGVA